MVVYNFEYRGWIRNLFFILFILAYDIFCRSYVISIADNYIEQNAHFGQNPGFGYIIFVLFIIETIGIFLGIRRLKYLQYKNRDVQTKGCLAGLNEFLFSFAALFHLMTAIFVYLVVINSTANYALGFFMLLLVLGREAYFMIRFFGIIGAKKEEIKEWKDLTKKQKNFVAISLTITSVVFYNVSWDLLINKMGDPPPGYGLFAFWFYFFFALILFLPVRLYFTLEDYYSLTDLKQRQKAFWSTIGILLIATITALI